MPCTRKQKKARKSRGLEIFSDVKNFDVMLGENHFNEMSREESLDSNSARRPESTTSNNLGNEEKKSYLNHRNVSSGINAEYGQNSVDASSHAEINRLSSEFNSRISREMDEVIKSVSVQIQRAINDELSNQVLAQIRNAIMADSGHMTRKRWDVPTERPETNSAVLRNVGTRDSSKNEHVQNRQNDDQTYHAAYDMVTEENESPIDVPEFLTGRIPSRSHLHGSHDDLNQILDTTIPAQERTVPAPEQDPINRLAEVLTSMQNRPTAQQRTIRPVNFNTMTFDGKSEKFELFEDLFHPMVKMQPEMSEQMTINHFHSLLWKNALQTFRNISTVSRQTLEVVLVIFRRKYVKSESQTTAKHKWHRLVFDPNRMKLPDFLEELNRGAEKAFGDNAQKMIDSLPNAKLSSKLKRSVNMARLENGSYDKIVAHLERELDLNGLEESDDLPMATMTSSSSMPKTPLSTGQTSLAIIARTRAIWSRTVTNWKRRKKKMPSKAKLLRRKHIPNTGLVARPTTQRNDVGKVPVHILNPSAPGPRIRLTTIPTRKPQNPIITNIVQLPVFIQGRWY